MPEGAVLPGGGAAAALADGGTEGRTVAEETPVEETAADAVDGEAAFTCGVCFEALPRRAAVKLDSCALLLCEDCVRRWVLWREAHSCPT